MRRHCNNESNYGNWEEGNRVLIRSEQACYLREKCSVLKLNCNNSGQQLFETDYKQTLLYFQNDCETLL